MAIKNLRTVTLTVRRLVRSSRTGGRHSRIPRKAVSRRFFPLTYVVRNLMVLKDEAWWERLSPRLKKARARKMILERSVFYLRVEQWREDRLACTPLVRSSVEYLQPADDGVSYCSHCGGCCEISSGLPEFPTDSDISDRWKSIFGLGLGRGHRFCPFLWEERCGGSLCSIHPWRSLACRIFEEDECDFFVNDPDFVRSLDLKRLMDTWRLFIDLVDGA